jgi:hypothetical protein
VRRAQGVLRGRVELAVDVQSLVLLEQRQRGSEVRVAVFVGPGARLVAEVAEPVGQAGLAFAARTTQKRYALVAAVFVLLLSSRRTEAGDAGASARVAPRAAATKGAVKGAPGGASVLAQLRSVGESVARAITQKKYEDLFSLLCVDDQAKTTKKKFAATLREVHRAGGTTLAEVGTEVDFLYENRRAGANKAEDFDKMTTVQAWVFRLEKSGWCNPLDD